jgi:hypothetical protein
MRFPDTIARFAGERESGYTLDILQIKVIVRKQLKYHIERYEPAALGLVAPLNPSLLRTQPFLLLM